MNSDDIIYLIFLLFSIFFGFYYRKIKDIERKKNIGAFLGFVLILLVSKFHTIHIIITILVNAFIILYIPKKFGHLISFIFSFLYLIFFRTTIYFDIPYPPNHTNLIQMMLTLKLVGLAFERNSEPELECNFFDIIYYSFNYIGVLTGPYYKFQTYKDHLYKEFNKHDNYFKAIYRKCIPLIPIYVAIYFLTDYLWPLKYTQSSEFENRSFFYRYWYIWPTFINFRMRIYLGLTLSECVCIMGGLGVYPNILQSKPGHGPTTENFEKFSVENSPEILKMLDYNYETVYSINSYATEFYPTLREGMKNWNMTVQYWLATCVYKRFPSKKFRIFATMLVSGIWHGIYAGYFISVLMIPFGLIIEDIWMKILLRNESNKVGYLIMLFLKMQFFSYAALAFSLLDVQKILHYYNSVYHWMIFFYIGMYILGKYLLLKKF